MSQALIIKHCCMGGVGRAAPEKRRGSRSPVLQHSRGWRQSYDATTASHTANAAAAAAEVPHQQCHTDSAPLHQPKRLAAYCIQSAAQCSFIRGSSTPGTSNSCWHMPRFPIHTCSMVWQARHQPAEPLPTAAVPQLHAPPPPGGQLACAAVQGLEVRAAEWRMPLTTGSP